MYRSDGALVLSPTDLTRFQACAHLTTLDLAVADHDLPAPAAAADEALELLFRKGSEHETRQLAALADSVDVRLIPLEPLAEAARQTEAAMREGAGLIYQAAFVHGDRRGHADFLVRTERPSALGDWAYDVADSKLARRLKVPALLQMAGYAEHLERIQGVAPQVLTVIAGDGVAYDYPYADVASYHRRATSRLGQFLTLRPATVAEPVAHCDQCRWQPQCAAGWRRADHLSLVAFLRTDHRVALEAAGISTVADLAASEAAQLPRSIGRATRERLVAQAALQLAERRTGRPHYELLAPAAGLGLLRLPEPDPADTYLDFEGDPYVEPAGREYLAGLGYRDGSFRPIWAHDAAAERLLTEQLVDHLLARWQANPGMHVYHYAPYERSALQRLTSRHGVREAELDILLRAEVLVDLYAVIRQGVRISKESYSIKKLEAFYWGHTRSEGEVADAMSSVIAYERWLIERDQRTLDEIESYNADDVRSTRDLHDWLEQRRAELAAGQPVAPDRPEPKPATHAEPNEEERAEAELAAALLAAGHAQLAGLVGWHRREQRPAWWEVFRLGELDDDELVEDGSALGGLSAPQLLGDVRRSHVYRYTFAPQDTRIRVGDAVKDVDTRQSAGTVQALSPDGGWLELTVARSKPAPAPRGLGPPGPLSDSVLRAAVAGTGRAVLAGTDTLGARLLRRVVPAGLPVAAGESPAAAVRRIGSGLAGGVLAVQGPPGSGKSTAAADLIRDLLDRGLRVGVTALSHQVIGNLLVKVGRPGLQRCDEANHCGSDQIDWAADNAAVHDALTGGDHRLVGGSAWLWARPELAGSVDVLVVDEAGQFALANAVAVAQAADSMVLVGDPQQLAQPSQAEHPHGAGVSALEHLLAGHATVPPDAGVFLDTTWRMHPTITALVSGLSYDGRLGSAPGLDRQSIVGGRWAGSGLRWLPVPHEGNESASTEEADAVAAAVAQLLDAQWTDVGGGRHPVTADDIVVVTPYNAQVALLRAALAPVAPQVRVGTVDKFQGREAVVVLYSLASSSAADAPRGVDFLYDLHRFTVAISRARALTVVVGSPALLDAPVRTPGQLRLVNALCRFVEEAEQVEATAAAVG